MFASASRLSSRRSRNTRAERAIKTRAAHSGRPAHALGTPAALHGHQDLDFVVDAFSPLIPLSRGRASTSCNTPLKNPTSGVFSASTRFNWLASFWRVDSRAFSGGGSSSPPSPLI
jgi:hypothetical protein